MGRRIISGPEVGYWVAGKMGSSFSPETATAIGLEKDGNIIAGVMYENWNGKSITAHMAVDAPITRSFLGAIFKYAYDKCAVEKVILPVSSGNQKSNKFVKNLGFNEEARIADAAPDGDIVLYTMKKDNCKFLGEQYG
jgi:RimJ/RimL family protein N-acetyltransferase